jgi:hypothetical protein
MQLAQIRKKLDGIWMEFGWNDEEFVNNRTSFR